jgi:hypothetical protein
MNIYWFQRSPDFIFKNLSEQLEDSGFSGILFPCSSDGDDPFISISRNINPERNIKYMVAVRPYTISAQYLKRISKSIGKISKNRILINFVTGWIYEQEKSAGGIYGNVDDLSSSIERSNYLIEYIENISKMKEKDLDFYVSVTNSIVFEKTKTNKVIIPYSWYKENRFDLSKVECMISLGPVIRKTQAEIDEIKTKYTEQDKAFFTEEEFTYFLNELQTKGFDGVLIFEETPNTEKNTIIKMISDFVKKDLVSPEGMR